MVKFSSGQLKELTFLQWISLQTLSHQQKIRFLYHVLRRIREKTLKISKSNTKFISSYSSRIKLFFMKSRYFHMWWNRIMFLLYLILVRKFLLFLAVACINFFYPCLKFLKEVYLCPALMHSCVLIYSSISTMT